jgi:acetyltransferase-like isoleucine patch superfamily enzyme
MMVVEFGTKVCPGVEIGDETTCGSGAVVIDSLPSHCLAYGCPAKIIHAK